MNYPLGFTHERQPAIAELQAIYADEHVQLQEICALSSALQLTGLEARYLSTLAKGGWCSVNALVGVWHSETGTAESCRVLIARLRRKLAPHGLGIERRYGLGYRLRPADLPLIRNIMADGRREAGL